MQETLVKCQLYDGIILWMGQIIESTAQKAKNNDFALVGSTGGNLTDSQEPATFSCANSLLEITIVIENLPGKIMLCEF